MAAGYKFKDIADVLSVQPSAITQTINGDIKSSRLRKALAVVAGCSVDFLWPDEEQEQKSPSSERTAGVVGGTADTVPEGGLFYQDKTAR